MLWSLEHTNKATFENTFPGCSHVEQTVSGPLVALADLPVGHMECGK